jgi:hypothetical protein
MNLTDRVTIPPQVMARQVGTETVILDLNSGTYFGLDPVGVRIWTLLSEGKTGGEAVKILLDEYDVEDGRAEQDVSNLLKSLQNHGLITIGNA